MSKLILLMCLLMACEPHPALTPFSASLPAQNAAQANTEVRIASTHLPTSVPQPIRTATLLPSDTPTLTLTPTLVPRATLIASPTYGLPPGIGTIIPTWTPPPPELSAQIADHYLFGRPISDTNANWISRTYPYGGTNSGRLQVHHGVDLINPTGVSILAAADGTVVYAGDDLTLQYGSMNNYYGNLVVLEHRFRTPQGEPVFTLYGHMLAPTVQQGQQVHEGDKIGIVGETGVALGPHLHFEVRIGDPYGFDATRNPVLWMRPFAGDGTLVGRVTDSEGMPLYGMTLTVVSTDISRETYTYGDASVNPDSAFGENFALGDLPANYYTVNVTDHGYLRFQRIIYIYANRSTWLDVSLIPPL